MKAWLREFRLIPIALVGLASLLVLKVAGLFLEGGYSLGERMNRGDTITVTTLPASNTVALRSVTVPLDLASTQPRKTPWLQELFFPQTTTASQNPSATPADNSIVTGSVPSKPPEPQAKLSDTKPPETKPAATPAAAPQETPRQPSPAERAVLERLGERRQQLDARNRELDIRENLLKAAEDKLKVQTTVPPGQEPAPTNEQPVVGRFKNLVTMYESMKPKDAAKIFDRLDLQVLVEMSNVINPRKMSEILAQMSPEVAEKLTVELAARARDPDKPARPGVLPKIEGRPIGG
jgi:flagellar motility protein MotE (MotC chaperone)